MSDETKPAEENKPAEPAEETTSTDEAGNKKEDKPTLLGESPEDDAEQGDKKDEPSQTKDGDEVKPKAPEGPPEKYELSLPEDSHLDQSHVDEIARYAREQGLSQEQASKLLERDNKLLDGYLEQRADAAREQQEKWVDELGNDKEFGGEHLRKNVELAKRVIHRFGSKALREQLNQTGLGSHPELVRAFIRIGKQMGEDTLRLPGAKAPKQERTMESVFYGDTQ